MQDGHGGDYILYSTLLLPPMLDEAIDGVPHSSPLPLAQQVGGLDAAQQVLSKSPILRESVSRYSPLSTPQGYPDYAVVAQTTLVYDVHGLGVQNASLPNCSGPSLRGWGGVGGSSAPQYSQTEAHVMVPEGHLSQRMKDVLLNSRKATMRLSYAWKWECFLTFRHSLD